MKKLFLKRIPVGMVAVLMVLSIALSTYMSANAGNNKAQSISLSQTELTLTVGETQSLTAIVTPSNANGSVKWSSSSKEIASVDKNGVVSGISTGKTTITVSTNNKLTASCEVTVKEAGSNEGNDDTTNGITKTEIEDIVNSRISEALSEGQYINVNQLDEYLNENGYIKANKLEEYLSQKGYVEASKLEELFAEKEFITKSEAEQLIANSCTCLSEEELGILINDAIKNYHSDESKREVYRELACIDERTELTLAVCGLTKGRVCTDTIYVTAKIQSAKVECFISDSNASYNYQYAMKLYIAPEEMEKIGECSDYYFFDNVELVFYDEDGDKRYDTYYLNYAEYDSKTGEISVSGSYDSVWDFFEWGFNNATEQGEYTEVVRTDNIEKLNLALAGLNKWGEIDTEYIAVTASIKNALFRKYTNSQAEDGGYQYVVTIEFNISPAELESLIGYSDFYINEGLYIKCNNSYVATICPKFTYDWETGNVLYSFILIEEDRINEWCFYEVPLINLK